MIIFTFSLTTTTTTTTIVIIVIIIILMKSLIDPIAVGGLALAIRWKYVPWFS